MPKSRIARAHYLSWTAVLSLFIVQNVLAQYRYQAVAGKTIGVWPDLWTVERLTELRVKFGFNSVLVPRGRSQYQAAIAAGFSPANIAIAFGHDDWHAAVDSFDAHIYYTDEAVEHDCAGNPSAGTLYTPAELEALRDYIHTRRPGSLFVSGGYKRCGHFRTLVTYVDKIMFTSYVNWSEFSIAVCNPNLGWGDAWERPWIKGADDQSPSWSWMRTNFGAKFSATWIRGRNDDYATLLPLATTLGLEGLWLYHGETIDTTMLQNFCNAAAQNGWMYRYTSPLSVQLSSLRASRLSSQSVRVEWLTASETNNFGFYVQRRISGAENFAELPGGFIPGAGTIIDPRSYFFVDNSAPSEPCEYRLRQVDLDSTSHFSEPVQVNVAGVDEGDHLSEFSLFQNYPNPFNPETRIRFRIPVSGFTTLRVLDLLGRELQTLQKGELNPGLHEYEFNASNVAAGVYLYELRSGQFISTRKLIVVK